jgi:DNA repair protein RadD
MQLRPYQTAAVEAVYEHLRTRDDNPCVVAPTGSGKAVLIAQIAKDAVQRWKGRVLVLAHVQELLEQNADKIRRLAPELPVGVYSAGLKRRDTSQPVIVAGIQSVYKRACELDPFNLVIVDEAHLVPPDGEGMYRQFLADAQVVNPHLRVIGLTATPYRLKSGLICAPDNILNAVCYAIGVKELIRDGYLSAMVSKAGAARVDTSELHVRAGEFVAEEVEQLMDHEGLVRSACAEIVELTRDRRSVLIFASGVKHGRHVVEVLKERHGIECGFVCGETPGNEREELLARFRGTGGDDLFGRRPLQYLCNVNVLTTGFDAPNVDCVVLLRPTASPGLYCQMVGRGFRLFPGKANCLVLDFGGNVLRHGPVDCIKMPDAEHAGNGEAPAKECPQCRALVTCGYARCPECGYEFPPPERRKHDGKASEEGILSGQVTNTRHDVQEVSYSVHLKRGAPEDAPRTLRVDYRIGLSEWQSEWVCVEHTGFARAKAAAWWKRRSRDRVPSTADEAVELANAGSVAQTKAILVRTVAGEPYPRVVDWELGPVPEPVSALVEPVYDTQNVPF